MRIFSDSFMSFSENNISSRLPELFYLHVFYLKCITLYLNQLKTYIQSDVCTRIYLSDTRLLINRFNYENCVNTISEYLGRITAEKRIPYVVD